MGEKTARLNSGLSKLTREQRIACWVEVCSVGCEGMLPHGNTIHALAKAEYVYVDKRTPLERFTAMQVQAKELGIDMPEDFVREIVLRLPAESVFPPRRKKK